MIPMPPDGKNLLDDLKWPVRYEYYSKGYHEVITNSIDKHHTIYVPRNPKDPLRWIEVQHEAAHCLLAEQVHHLFSASYFKKGTPDNLLNVLNSAFRAAQDWFVDEVLYRHWPQVVRSEVKEHLELMFQFIKTQPEQITPETGWGTALFFAQAKRYKCAGSTRKKIARSAPVIKKAADVFLAIDPSQPSIHTTRKLINKILRLATPHGQKPFQVRLVMDDGLEVWELYQK